MHKTLETAYRWGQTTLSEAGIENAGMEAAWLMRLGGKFVSNSAELVFKANEKIQEGDWRSYQKRILDRAGHVPFAYLIGMQEFFGLDFCVTPDVLIPRPETETLVSAVLRKLKSESGGSPRSPRSSCPRVLEIGAGSGNISVSLAKNLQRVEILALDVSEKALAVARANAKSNGVDHKVRFVRKDCRDLDESFGKFDYIVSNPPYIKSSEIGRLQKEIQSEPEIALDGGGDGLDLIKTIISRSILLLKPTGFLCLELGYDQSCSVEQLLKGSGFERIEKELDCGGVERVICAVFDVSL